MDIFSIILDAIIGFLLGILLILIYYYFRIVRISPSGPANQESKVTVLHTLNPESIIKLYENWIIEGDELSNEEIDVLKALGFIKEQASNILIVDAPKLKKFLLEASKILNEEQPPIIELKQKYLTRLASIGIKSITFIKISSELGPTFLYTTTPTRLTRKLYRDVELLNNIFFMIGKVEEARVEGSRIIIKEIEGGERGLEGFLIVEVSQTADLDKIKDRILGKINKIPEDPEQATELLEMIL